MSGADTDGVYLGPLRYWIATRSLGAMVYCHSMALFILGGTGWEQPLRLAGAAFAGVFAGTVGGAWLCQRWPGRS